jgi:hypothetical protein
MQKSNKKDQGCRKMAKNCSLAFHAGNSLRTYIMKGDATGSNNPARLPASLEGSLLAIFLTPFF